MNTTQPQPIDGALIGRLQHGLEFIHRQHDYDSVTAQSARRYTAALERVACRGGSPLMIASALNFCDAIAACLLDQRLTQFRRGASSKVILGALISAGDEYVKFGLSFGNYILDSENTDATIRQLTQK